MSDYQERDPETEVVLKDIGRIIKGALPPGKGFALMIFDYGENGNMFYISSGQRQDMIKAMEEFIERNKH